MGISTRSISFFMDTIEIDAHTARYPEHLRQISLREFSQGQPLRLESVEETGEYIATRQDGAFVQGPEI